MKQSEYYCLDFLKKKEHDYYISVLFAPISNRGGLAALYAFHLELAHISKIIREPLPGMVRLRWWRDTLKSGYGEGSPIATALLKTIKQHNLSLNTFFRMCDTRIFDFYHDPFPDYASLKNYYKDTIASTLQIACQILAPKEASLCFEVCYHGAIALGISNLISQFSHMRKIYIPQDILEEAGATYENMADNAVRKRVTLTILFLGYQHYNSFITALHKLPKKIRPAFLPLSPLPSLFAKIEKAKVFEKNTIISPLRRQWIISYTALTGKFPMSNTLIMFFSYIKISSLMDVFDAISF